jgi:hypothetical protein
VDLTRDADQTRLEWRFHQLPARPLVRREIRLDAVQDAAVETAIRRLVAETPVDAVLTVRVVGTLGDAARRVLSAANLRRLAPATMNIDLKLEDEDGAFVRRTSSRQSDVVLELPLG